MAADRVGPVLHRAGDVERVSVHHAVRPIERPQSAHARLQVDLDGMVFEGGVVRDLFLGQARHHPLERVLR